MKKINLALLALTVLGTASATTTFADENNRQAESKISVGIEPGDDTEPTDPIEPGEPGDGGTGQTGNLTIDKVSNLDFGSFKLSSESIVVTANQDKETNPSAQVTDKRGTGAGWDLQVEVSDFKSEDSHTIKGAQLSLPKGELKTNNVDNTAAPENYALEVNNQPQTLMSAEIDKGMGSWANVFDKTQTKLMIPAGNYAGEYGATLTWTLTNAPK